MRRGESRFAFRVGVSPRQMVDEAVAESKIVRDAELAIRYIDETIKARVNIQRHGPNPYLAVPVPVDAGRLGAKGGIYIDPTNDGHILFLRRVRDELNNMMRSPRRISNIPGALERWSQSR